MICVCVKCISAASRVTLSAGGDVAESQLQILVAEFYDRSIFVKISTMVVVFFVKTAIMIVMLIGLRISEIF